MSDLSTPVSSIESPQRFHELVLVRLDQLLFAVDVEVAIEVRGPEKLHRRSDGAHFLSVRGQQLPVVDLGKISGNTGFAASCPAMLLLKAGMQTIALAVDQVLGIESISAERVQACDGIRSGFPFCNYIVSLSPLSRIPLIDPVAALAIKKS